MKPNKITRKLLPFIMVVGAIFCQLLSTGAVAGGFHPEAAQTAAAHHHDVVEVVDDAAVTARATLRNPLKYLNLSKPVETPAPVSFTGVLRYAIALSTFSKQSPCYGLLFLQHLF